MCFTMKNILLSKEYSMRNLLGHIVYFVVRLSVDENSKLEEALHCSKSWKPPTLDILATLFGIT